MSIKITNSIDETDWKSLSHHGSPFLSYEFFKALESSESIGADSGWDPFYLNDPGKSCLYTFIKAHSYGEYIFDWDWANFYHQYNIPYYPKLTSMIPFTSATSSHFLGENSKRTMEVYEEFYNKNDFSSSHFLFIKESECEFFKSFDYIIRDSFQYHFINKNYADFEDFLSKLKSRKAKQIRKERMFKESISIHRYSGNELTFEHAKQMYAFYLSTTQLKQAIPYLKEEFFIQIFENLKDNVLYVEATHDHQAVGGALYFYGKEHLYGRYWGSNYDVPNLHFELCYYQGIEFCIERSIKLFEAGAQGEHKISRGFRPAKTYSAHKFKHPEFSKAISKYIEQERSSIDEVMEILRERLPFKS